MFQRRRIAVVAAVIVGSIATISPPVASAASVPYPIRNIPLAEGAIFVVPAPGGRFASYQGPEAQQTRVDLATGATTLIVDNPNPQNLPYLKLDDDGQYAFGVSQLADSFYLRNVATGVTETFAPFPPFPWFVSGVVDVDASGRYVLLDASSGALALVRAFLYDTTTRKLVTPDPVGLSTGTNQSHGVSISDDGRSVTFSEIVTGGAPIEKFVRWDRVTDQRTEVFGPPETGVGDGGWTISPDFRWMMFGSSASGVLPGLDAGLRYYRRNVATGRTDLVPAMPDRLESFDIVNGGRVIFSQTVVTALGDFVPQLFTWDGAGPPIMITTGPDGLPADAGFGRAASNDDGTVITFTSGASNLPPVRPTFDTERLFEVSLPAAGTLNDAAVVRASETYCVAAVGAEPGDFVGVNITPVLATTPGFGVLHSSDDPAGSTSNVNFGAGSVDPNVAFAKVGANGQICFTNSVHGPVHVIIDEMIVADAAAFRAPTGTGSARLADTRTGLGGPIVAASETRCLAAVGAGPGEFVGVNVLPVAATTPGFGTIHPSGTAPGPSSTANFGPGTFDPNFAFTQVGADGQICFTNSVHGPVHLIVDELIVSTATAMARPTPGPASDRPVDTRAGIGGPRLAAGGRTCFAVPGSNPGDFGAVNILPVTATGPGFGTLHSSADLPGSTSNVNYGVGTFDPNLGIAQFGSDNQMCFTNGPISATDVIIDSQIIAKGDVFREPTPDGSVRLVDTRIARA